MNEAPVQGPKRLASIYIYNYQRVVLIVFKRSGYSRAAKLNSSPGPVQRSHKYRSKMSFLHSPAFKRRSENLTRYLLCRWAASKAVCENKYHAKRQHETLTKNTALNREEVFLNEIYFFRPETALSTCCKAGFKKNQKGVSNRAWKLEKKNETCYWAPRTIAYTKTYAKCFTWGCVLLVVIHLLLKLTFCESPNLQYCYRHK